MRKLGLPAGFLALACATLAYGQAPPAATPAPYHEAARISGPDGGWDYANFDPIRHRIYVAHGAVVTAIDANSNRVLASFGGLQRTHQALPLGDGTEILVTDGGDNSAHFLNADTGAEIAHVATGAGPDAAIVEPMTGLVAVMDHAGGAVTLIDPRTHAAVGEIAVGGTLEAAAADGAGRIFVNVEDQSVMAVINVQSRRVEARVALPGCDGPTGLAFAAESHLLVASCGNNQAAVVDARSRRFERLIAIGAGPDTAMYDASRHVVLIPCGRSGELDVIDGAATHVVAHVPTQTSARTGAVDPATGRVYLPAATYNAAPAPGQRPSLQPGSFVVIVLVP